MKQTILLLMICLCSKFAFSQGLDEDAKKEVTEYVNKKAVTFKKQFEKKHIGSTKQEVEYAVDTFKVEQFADRETKVIGGSHGYAFGLMDRQEGYDKLMNKYYKLLLGLLKEEDKQLLITSQRAWLTFRDAEMKVLDKINEPQYVGKGSMFTINAGDMSMSLLIARTQQLFDSYNLIKSQQE